MITTYFARGAVAGCLLAGSALAAAPAHADAGTADVYLVQGLTGSTTTLQVDGRTVAQNAAAKAIVGPIALSPGQHRVAVDSSVAGQDFTSTITVPESGSMDAVIHRQADPSAAPVITTFGNDTGAVTPGSGRVTVAHTAAVGPADVKVDNKVLFANIANGEALTLTVPAKTYSVQIVPTGGNAPVVLGPVNLPVAKNQLTRVFAIGVAANKSMDAVVHVLPLGANGNGKVPARVEAGNGGQAAGLQQTGSATGGAPMALWGFGGVAAAAVALRARRRSGVAAD